MKITVVTITYNQKKHLEKQLETLMHQREFIKEWILYDDGSTDGTIEKFTNLILPFPYKYIQGKKREKPLVVANMNEAIKWSEGPFLLIFGDTYLGEDALKNLSQSYVHNSFGCSYRINVTESGKFIANHFPWDSNEVMNVMQQTKPWEFFSGNGMIATKEIMEKIGYIDEEYGGYGIDDYDTAMRAMMNGAELYIYNNVKLYHIDHPTKDSTKDNVKRYQDKLSGTNIRMK